MTIKAFLHEWTALPLKTIIMKILYIITKSELGGAQSVVVALANHMHNLGHDVIVAAGEGDGLMWKLLDDGIRQIKCKHLFRNPSLKEDLLLLREFRQIGKIFSPDVVHLHSSKAGMVGRMAFRRSSIVYTVHGFDSIRLANRRFLFLEKMMQYRCKAIVGVSKYDEHYLRAEGINHNVSYVYNGISRINSNNDITLPIGKEFEKTILCIARNAAPKRPDIFIETARLLPQYAFVWIGNLEKVQVTMPKNVFFLGTKVKAARYNLVSDLFMLPSNYEGLPITIIEAMSLGKPVVASNVGGISEIVRDGENGFTVENIPEEFAEKIRYILENPETYEKLSKAAQRRWKQNLTLEKMIEGYEKIYKKVTN